jgi:hypothetical protein
VKEPHRGEGAVAAYRTTRLREAVLELAACRPPRLGGDERGLGGIAPAQDIEQSFVTRQRRRIAPRSLTTAAVADEPCRPILRVGKTRANG